MNVSKIFISLFLSSIFLVLVVLVFKFIVFLVSFFLLVEGELFVVAVFGFSLVFAFFMVLADFDDKARKELENEQK